MYWDPMPSTSASASVPATAALSDSKLIPRMRRALSARAIAAVAATHAGPIVYWIPGGRATPGVSHHVQSVVSPPNRITGDWPGVRLRTSCMNTESGSAGSVPKYSGADRYSMDKPTYPGATGRLTGRLPTLTRMAEDVSVGCAPARLGVSSPPATATATRVSA